MIRVCPERDAVCPYGDNCPYSIDRYECKSERPRPMTPDPITTARPPIRIYALDAAVYDDGSFDIQEHNQHSIGFKRSREAVIILRDELTRLIEAGPYLCPEAKVRS